MCGLYWSELCFVTCICSSHSHCLVLVNGKKNYKHITYCKKNWTKYHGCGTFNIFAATLKKKKKFLVKKKDATLPCDRKCSEWCHEVSYTCLSWVCLIYHPTSEQCKMHLTYPSMSGVGINFCYCWGFFCFIFLNNFFNIDFCIFSSKMWWSWHR